MSIELPVVVFLKVPLPLDLLIMKPEDFPSSLMFAWSQAGATRSNPRVGAIRPTRIFEIHARYRDIPYIDRPNPAENSLLKFATIIDGRPPSVYASHNPE